MCFFFCYSAKSTELLHSPPVFESDLDTVDHDYSYDYAVPVPDDDFYYVSWDDAIYDVFQEYDYTGKDKFCLELVQMGPNMSKWVKTNQKWS